MSVDEVVAGRRGLGPDHVGAPQQPPGSGVVEEAALRTAAPRAGHLLDQT
ncbi:hypothetical protein [Micromonospora sp. RTP1Z1]|nr:hypothetical protein [Micromonospora sp. RTP1Z1]